MRKIVDLCFYFLLKKKLGKSTFFLVLDKETPLRVGDTGIYGTEFCKIYRTFQYKMQNIQKKLLKVLY